MRNIKVNTLEHISLVDLTDIWNRCWQGYCFNMMYMPEHMRVWLHLSQVSLRHSIAIFIEDQVVGFTLLSMDGIDGWIAGACIDPDYRRKGLFTPLMRSQLKLATRIGIKRVYLEVLEQNYALKIYQSVGFTCTRRLNIYRSKDRIDFFNSAVEEQPLKKISMALYFKNRSRSLFNPGWQRREGYVRRYGHSLALINSAGTAGVLYAGDKNALCLDAWSATEAGAEEVISTVLGRPCRSFSLTNQPEDWITTCLTAHGINPSAKQFEMCIVLA